MSRWGFEPGPLAFWASVANELSYRDELNLLERWPGTPEARVRILVVTCSFSLLSWLVIYLLFDV